jgi:hypothetical protein
VRALSSGWVCRKIERGGATGLGLDNRVLLVGVCGGLWGWRPIKEDGFGV